MVRRRRAENAFILALVALALVPRARLSAQELVPPELVDAVQAVYPADAQRDRIEGTVVLRITIDVEGHVTEAEVIEPAGHGFDAAAREAVLRSRFTPALRDGQPIAARIRYPYAFKLAPEPVTAPPAATPPAATPPAAALPHAVEVTVRGTQNDGERLQQSAEAVNVIDLRRAKQQTADMGEVLARTQGVSVRRSGGLGSEERFSLDGLYDDQVRFFLDGVPLDLAGYPFGIVNVPVNLTDRVEVYRGVVPIRFGADALGGAVNLVSDQSYDSHLGASYQLGSFGTRRLTLDGRYRDLPTGLVVGATTFLDATRNDYPVDIEIPDQRGRLSPATVPRFHDDYETYGGTVEFGVVDRAWARRLLLQVFASTYDKQLQHNAVMTVPYGEVAYGESVYGATLRYEVALRSNVDLELVANHNHRAIDFVDKSQWVYNWRGVRVRMRRVPGEIEGEPSDQTVWQDGSFGRATLKWAISAEHIVRVSMSPAFTTRSGDERIQANPDARDPLTAKQELFTFVSGVEYELNLFQERLSNVVFVKDYVYAASSEESLPGDVFRARDTDSHRLGAGDSLRFRFTPWLYAKASYEYATRLPRPDEVFGDGVLVLANLELQPEVSHNANVGPRVELRRTTIGDVTLDVNAFVRDADRLIVLLGNDRFFAYQNVYAARGLGLENALSWISPGRWVGLDGVLTWQEVRNASDRGTFRDFKGDRIPNRPYLFASWGARLRLPNMPGADDTIEPFYNGRYVHEFFRGWESQGLRQFKQVVDAQVTHSIGVSWLFNRDIARLSSTLEIDNVTDVKAFDNFGVQRPGRAFYLKFTGEI